MEITLKRALKLRKELEAKLAKLDLPLTTRISLLVARNQTDPMAAIGEGGAALAEQVDQFNRLSLLLAQLREVIDETNARVGVSFRLAMAAHYDRELSVQRKIASAKIIPDAEVVAAEVRMSVAELTTPSDRGYSRPQRDIEASTVSQEARDAALLRIAELKRLKEGVDDERAGLNASLKIELSEGDGLLLTKLGLI